MTLDAAPIHTAPHSAVAAKVEFVPIGADEPRLSSRKTPDSAAWQQQAGRYQQLLQILPAAVLVIDQQGKIAQANPAAVKLFAPMLEQTALLGLKWRILIQECFAPRRDDGHEVSLMDGRKVQLKTTAMAGQPGQLVLISDLTETRALQSKLAQHQRLSSMGRMVASLAHQVRTPLSAANLYAEHLENAALEPELRTRFVGKLRERLKHLEHQIQDMLIFARGELPLNDDILATDILDALLDAMDVPLKQYQACCQVSRDCVGIRVRCNKEALVSALMNLVNNALEATQGLEESKRTLEIQFICSEREGPLSIRIRDHGVGIAASQLARMLEPFATTKTNGTGLGLAVVQAVVRAHGGEFQLQNATPSGLLACINIPVYQANEEPRTPGFVTPEVKTSLTDSEGAKV